MSEMIWTKKKQGNRRVTSSQSRNGRSWSGKPSVLMNQKVEKRARKNFPTSAAVYVQENSPAQRPQKRWVNDSGRALGMRALEGGVFLAAGLSMMAKNGFDSLADLLREGKNAIINVDWSLDPSQDEGQDAGDSYDSELEGDEAGWYDDPEELRLNVEMKKITRLHHDEDGLDGELLEDQAGALRSLFPDQSAKV